MPGTRAAILIALLALLPRAGGEMPALLFDRLPPADAMALSSLGSLYIGAGPRVAEVFGSASFADFVSTRGRVAGMAFDAADTLYIADRGRAAILAVSPTGQQRVAATTCGGRALISPVDVTASFDSIWFADEGRSAVCRMSGEGAPAAAAEIPSVTTLAASTMRPEIVAGTRAGTLWTLSLSPPPNYTPDARGKLWPLNGRPRKLAVLDGRISSLALDAAGDIYAACGARIYQLDSEGRVKRTYALPGEVTRIAFGAANRSSLWAAVSSGRVYEMPAAQPGQPPVWEAPKMLRIVHPSDGDILNHTDGTAVRRGLQIAVDGEVDPALAPPPSSVKVNGKAVPLRDGKFAATVVLTARETNIVAEAEGVRDTVTILWDRNSIPRYRMSVDDNIWWLRDIARQQPASIFDNPYLAFWRDMHRKYGTRIHFNIYYETEGFTLAQMPARYREEWSRNSDWIRLSFHARANDPDRPYLHSTAARIAGDYHLVNREIERFAGKELLSPLVTTIHWGAASPDAMQALWNEGVRILAGYFELRRGLPGVSYDLRMPQVLHLAGRDYWKDTRRGFLFVRHDMVINTVKLEDIVPALERLAADPHQSEIFELMIHEQYFYSSYKAYLPDYQQRVERALQWVTQKHYKSVFWDEGFLGAPERAAR